ncbi:MAG: exodeoxyribonuclease VII large subunit, partial [Ruminococcaceae bacterium]|nr:exodeoxyribonuclease VII large subunit [Oscillospiraceae bacterium]
MMDPYKKVIVTVSQLNQFTKMLFDGNEFLSDVFVKGEISNFVNHRTGHFYFSLKDENATLKAVMFRTSAARLAFMPENGMKVIVHGRVSVFERDGVYQLYADDIQPDGIGSLYYAYEQLKKKLEDEGLFRESHKKPIPRFPGRVGIITSPTGAAIRDMTNIIGRRFPLSEMVLYPSLVQGPDAAAQLASGIKYFNESRSVDAIIIGRGGGSIE